MTPQTDRASSGPGCGPERLWYVQTPITRPATAKTQAALFDALICSAGGCFEMSGKTASSGVFPYLRHSRPAKANRIPHRSTPAAGPAFAWLGDKTKTRGPTNCCYEPKQSLEPVKFL